MWQRSGADGANETHPSHGDSSAAAAGSSRAARRNRRLAATREADSSSGPMLPPTVVEVAAQDTVADAAIDAAKKPLAAAPKGSADRQRSGGSQSSTGSHSTTMVARLDLASQAVRMLEEVRIIMPSVQMLAGFQFIAVFNQRFTELPRPWQTVHYSSLLLATLTVCCMLSVAAFHRIAEPHKFTLEFVRRGGWTVSIGLLFLATAICLDIGVVAQLIYGSTAGAIAAAASSWAIFILAWFAYPIGHRIHYYGLANLHHNYGGDAHAGTASGSGSGAGSVNGSGSGGLGAGNYGSGGALSDAGTQRHGSPGQAGDDDDDDDGDGGDGTVTDRIGGNVTYPCPAPTVSASGPGQTQVQRMPQKPAPMVAALEAPQAAAAAAQGWDHPRPPVIGTAGSAVSVAAGMHPQARSLDVMESKAIPQPVPQPFPQPVPQAVSQPVPQPVHQAAPAPVPMAWPPASASSAPPVPPPPPASATQRL